MTNRSQVTYRPIHDGDLEFLCQLYGTSRDWEMAVVDWSEEQKVAFLRSQFEAQHKFYTEQFTRAEFSMILLDGREAGRLYVDRRDDEIRLIDIALMPVYRNQGTGGAILKELLAEAGAIGKPVRIHVERYNPALRLYERLGFTRIEDQSVYFLMEWRPGAMIGESC